MALYSDPPPLRPFSEDKPTLLVCWWITSFCAVIIALRVIGRFIRTEKLFREDTTAALALVPLILRMGCVHVILTHGTNNARLDGAGLSDKDLHRRSIASGLVLLSRVLYAATLWILKYAILEFFRRLNINWRRTYDLSLLLVRGLLIATFIAVVISDLAECHPFSHYWQVLPDPGGRCRQGFAQLLTMAVCNVVTDLTLVVFPVPVILSSSMSAKRKFHLVLLFSLSLAPVAVTIYRVPHIIRDGGSQQMRSLYASVELLFATAAANTLVLGSFVRDRGVKKRRYKYDSVAAVSVDHSSASESRRPTVLRHWGSDEDLVRDLGLGVKPELRDDYPPSKRMYIPAAPVTLHQDMNAWRFPGQDRLAVADPTSERRDSTATTAHRRVSFFDYGGLLDDQPPPNRRKSSLSSDQSGPPPTTVPEQAVTADGSGFRRGSVALLQDIGGFLAPPGFRGARLQRGRGADLEGGQAEQVGSASTAASPPAVVVSEQQGGVAAEPELRDVGGLLETPRLL
ncbi:hypothetical protein C8A05DRAFT_45960 [Staphylotrichum tortipilum]|uniref:Rhodopsin domain-containing protein n=1 Tax=Staphylotrichum tortipilum TaxID=2831512 RepID=A0AAN6MHQ5_9PEZI|nr:hypothetical protein C8A05DRAFT_45960 [Staphylotrichum longicolle]